MIQLTLVVQLLFELGLTPVERESVTRCLFPGKFVSRDIDLHKLEACLTKQVPFWKLLVK